MSRFPPGPTQTNPYLIKKKTKKKPKKRKNTCKPCWASRSYEKTPEGKLSFKFQNLTRILGLNQQIQDFLTWISPTKGMYSTDKHPFSNSRRGNCDEERCGATNTQSSSTRMAGSSGTTLIPVTNFLFCYFLPCLFSGFLVVELTNETGIFSLRLLFIYPLSRLKSLDLASQIFAFQQGL